MAGAGRPVTPPREGRLKGEPSRRVVAVRKRQPPKQEASTGARGALVEGWRLQGGSARPRWQRRTPIPQQGRWLPPALTPHRSGGACGGRDGSGRSNPGQRRATRRGWQRGGAGKRGGLHLASNSPPRLPWQRLPWQRLQSGSGSHRTWATSASEGAPTPSWGLQAPQHRIDHHSPAPRRRKSHCSSRL